MKIYFNLIFILLFGSLYAQDNPTLINMPPAPEAAGLGEYGDIPLSEYSGAPGINIPIYNLSYRELSLPINLSYHSNGNRVTEEASWVGLGWNLDVGGMITRSIRGFDDFGVADASICSDYLNYYEHASSLPSGPGSNWDYHGYLQTLAVSGCFQDCEFSNGNIDSEDFCPNSQFKRDLESDLYTFNLPGASGKFYLDRDGNFITINAQNIDIQETVNGPLDISWVITTGNGVQYHLGTSRSGRQHTYTYNKTYTKENDNLYQAQTACGTVDGEYISTWFLEKIVSPNGHEINLTYKHNASQKIISIPAYSETFKDLMLEKKYLCNLTGLDPYDNHYTKTATLTKYDQIYLDYIVYEYGKIDFLSTPNRSDLTGGFRLDDIVIYQGDLINPYKRFHFSYDYFNSTSPSNDNNRWDYTYPGATGRGTTSITFPGEGGAFLITSNLNSKRLKLNSVQDMGTGTTSEIPAYVFNYSATSLPLKTSLAVDHWGFSNGKETNEQLVSPYIEDPAVISLSVNSGYHFINGYFLGADRKPGSGFTDAAILNSIQYPTGGSTDLEFENNKVGVYQYEPIGMGTGNIDFYVPSFGSCNNLVLGTNSFSLDDGKQATTEVLAHLSFDWVKYPCPTNCSSYCIGDESNGHGFKVILTNTEDNSEIEWFHSYGNLNGTTYTYSDDIILDEGNYTLKIRGLNGGSESNYLPNDVSSINFKIDWQQYEYTTEKSGGGLRVKKITDYANGVANTRVYNYLETTGNSSGKMFNEPIYNYRKLEISTAEDVTPTGQCPDEIAEQSKNLYVQRSSSSIRPLSSSYVGNFVGYNRVEVFHGENSEKGSSIKTYFNQGNIGHPEFFDRYGVGVLSSTKDGSLLRQMDYDASGKKVHEVENVYQSLGVGSFPLNWNFKVAFFSDAVTPFPFYTEGMCQQGLPTILAYADTRQWHYLSTSYERFYDESGTNPATKTTNYEYENQRFRLRSDEMTNSDGNSYKTEYYYPDEKGFTHMTDRWMYNIPVEFKKYGGGTYTGGFLIDYNSTYPVSPKKFTEFFDDNSSVVRSEVLDYEDGYPSELKRMELPFSEHYNWTNGLIDDKTYQQWFWDYEYNNFRMVEKITDIDKQETEYLYDNHQRPEKIIARNGNIKTNISYAMGSGNSVTTEIEFTDAPNQTSINQYDGLGRLIKNILNGVTKNEIEYDNLGRVKKQTYLPGNFTFLEYDDSPLNRVTKEIYPDGSFIEMIHGAESNYIKLKNFDEKGNLTQTLTDFFGQTGQITDAINGITKYDYNNKNLLELVTPPAGSPYSYVYDERNRLIEKSIPGANTQYFDYYDSDDRLKFSLDANGNRLDYEYDDYGREYNVRLNENIDVASGSQGSPGGSIITRAFGESLGGINVGKLIQESAAVFGGPGGMTEATHTYDMFGRIDFTDEKYPLGNGTSVDKIDYTYNHADWLTSEVRDHVGYQTMSVGTVYDYDNFGRLIARFKGIQGQGDGLAVGMRYNDRDQMTLKKLGISGVFQSLDKISYAYSERGWLKKMNDVIAKTSDHTLCQQPNDPQDPVQEEDNVNLEDLLEIFCSGEDVIINDLDPCNDGGCYIEVSDYVATFSLYDNDIDGIVGVYGENNDLLPLNYSYLTDEFTSLETDLANWLAANGYIFDEVKVNYTVNNTNPPSYTGNLSILQTNYNFQSLDYLLKSNNTLTTRFKKQNRKYIPCKNEPGKPIGEDSNQSFAVAQLDAQIATANSSSLSYPTTLYKVLLLDGSIRWVFQEELSLLEGSYTRLDRIYVKDANKNFHVERSDGTTDNLALPQLLAVRPAGDLERVESDDNDDPSTECDLTPLGCTPYDQTQQANSIEDIMNAMCNMPLELLSFPIDLHLVQLCDGTTTYVLGDSLVNEIQGPHIILDVTTIDGPDTGINILAVKKERLFAMNFDYEPNGNIEKLKWKVTDNTIKYYQNSYDPLNRIINANYGEELLLEGPNGNLIYTVDPNDIYKAFGFSYDAVGNIEGLSRYGMVPDGNCFTAGLIDQLSYTTDGSTNRLLGVTDNAPSQYRQYGFKPNTHPTSNGIYYEYDDNGNLIVDHHKNLQISYNFLNLPEQVTGGGTVTYTYDALGRKWAKDGTTGKQEYVGSIEYKDGKLDAVYDEDGRVVAEYSGSGLTPTSYRAEYWHKDHLGNTRLAFSDLDHSGHISFSDDPDTPGDDMEIMQENHYYPFGMNQDGPWYETVVPENKYQYNGKELNTDLGLNWNDYGARWYDASIGRWNAIDPLADDFFSFSPYNYVFNTPFRLIDPDGTSPDDVHIRISAKPIATTQIRLINSEYYRGAPKLVDVSVYQMTVTDDVTGKTSHYSVTRDGPVVKGANSDGTFEVVNTTFEPATNNQKFVGIASEYPEKTGLMAITFGQEESDGSINRYLDAESNPYADRESSDKAKGNSIHVGETYTAADGTPTVTGSLGCFTLCGADGGDKGNANFKKDIENRATLNRRAGKGGKINITVDKRPNNAVILKANVNSSGKATQFLERQK